MDSRLYFVLGDLFSNVLVGALVGWICALLVVVGWNPALSMLLGLTLGLVLALVSWIPLGMLFGAMEVMLPVMLSGMLSGTVLSIWATVETLESKAALSIGGICGLTVIVGIWILNSSVRGRQCYGLDEK